MNCSRNEKAKRAICDSAVSYTDTYSEMRGSMFRINIEAKTIEKSRLREKIEHVPLLITGRTFPVNKPEPFQKLPKRSEISPMCVCV